MKPVIAFLLVILVHSSLLAQHGWRTGEMEVKVFVASGEDAAALRSFDLNTEAASPDGSTVYAFVVPKELDLIRAAGLVYEVLIPDLNEHYRDFWSRLVPPGYHTYDQIVALADSLVTAFPAICRKVLFGASVDLRQLAALKISKNVNLDEPEPEILFDGGIHGDEVGGSENMILFARDLCKGYGTNPVYTDLIDTREIWIYYMVNPDGRVYMTRYNDNGVDCNRDFCYMWNGEGFSTGACSQPESRALRNCILDNQFVVYTNYHSGTEVIAYPWSYRSDSPPDIVGLNHLAGVYSEASGYSFLQYGQGYNIMYAINGSTKDFQYGSMGNIGWSIEISYDKQPPANQVSLYYNENLPAMTEMIKQSGYGIGGMITDTFAGTPVRATIWVSDLYPVSSDPSVGDYHKYLAAGYYSLKVTAGGYKTKTIQDNIIPSNGTLTRDFQLVPDDHWYAWRVISCQIPGNNFSDVGYTPGTLGAPDGIPYAIGKNGWIILDMGDTVFNGPGPEIRVFEASAEMKGFTCFAGETVDGPWKQLGGGSGTTDFDLTAGNLSKARYFKITDDGDGPSSGIGAGFDLDAIEMLTKPLRAEFGISVNNFCEGTGTSFIDESTGNPVTWNWSFPEGVG